MSKDRDISLGERIKEDIKSKNLNGSAIARKMNVSRQVINQIDLRKKFDLQFLQSLKEASGLDYTHYAFDTVMANVLKDDEPSYTTNMRSSNNVTLTFAVSCKKDRVGEFSNFLSDVEEIAVKYGYQLI
jgi:transcriptional regulator with XRE-family HTH domain